MGLRDVLSNAAQQAFNAFDDVPVTATLHLETTTHDPLTAGSTVASTALAIRQCAMVRFKREEIGAPIQGSRGALLSNRTPIEAGDTKAIFQQKEVPGATPSTEDRFTANGVEWRIMGVAADPADVLWLLQLRSR